MAAVLGVSKSTMQRTVASLEEHSAYSVGMDGKAYWRELHNRRGMLLSLWQRRTDAGEPTSSRAFAQFFSEKGIPLSYRTIARDMAWLAARGYAPKTAP